ncbi:hypothetical protein BG842_18420 [Haladaptatus sp. W1]|uniref:helix-turn-helix domain-containing protein n=1 Tax=Haladaptatus sp. W1 TaxID=1897478 RepID=UPI0008496F9C|nr:helix-turn-helix domain-containing protein [Haladaptatus sp. W1]ODR82551.1 hypothetical protein BG842_18420 [Haladaptatus sp. W1]
MSGGIRVKLCVGDSTACPVTTISECSEVTSVTRSTTTTDTDDTTVEFTAKQGLDDPGETGGDEMTAVFEYDTETIYRFALDSDDDCPCDHVERYGCPIRETRADRGRVMLSFICSDVSTLQSIIEELKSRYSSVAVQQLARTTSENCSASFSFVDESEFTDRQYEVLQTSHEMGYFEHPKRANAGDVAGELGISTPTLVEHLSAVQSKLLEQLLDNG